jgi:hypothetical protein
MASTHVGAPADFLNPRAILAKSPMAVKEEHPFPGSRKARPDPS